MTPHAAQTSARPKAWELCRPGLAHTRALLRIPPRNQLWRGLCFEPGVLTNSVTLSIITLFSSPNSSPAGPWEPRCFLFGCLPSPREQSQRPIPGRDPYSCGCPVVFCHHRGAVYNTSVCSAVLRRKQCIDKTLHGICRNNSIE